MNAAHERASRQPRKHCRHDTATDKNTHTVFLSFYIQDGRLTSQDITTRWRLDIWQDVIEDMVQDDIVIKGYGYNEIIPAMIDPNKPGRTGRDGKNENLHNYKNEEPIPIYGKAHYAYKK